MSYLSRSKKMYESKSFRTVRGQFTIEGPRRDVNSAIQEIENKLAKYSSKGSGKFNFKLEKDILENKVEPVPSEKKG